MKRLLSFLTVLCLLLSMMPAVQVFAAEPVTVYMDPKKGSNENLGTEDSPVQNFSTAYTFLQNGGGRIIMLSTVYYAGAVTLPACNYPVTICAKNSADGIRTGSNLIVSGETTFENMTFTHLKDSTATVISGNGHKLTMGEGLTFIPFENETDTYYFCLQGGSPSGAVANTDLTVLSGQYRNIYAGSYTKSVTGNSKLTMSGGTAATVAAGYSSTMGGNVDITFGGSATVTGSVYSGSWSKGDVGGDVTVTLGKGAKLNNLFAAGNGTGSVLGNVTVNFDGYENTLGIFKGTGNTSHTGTIGSSRLVLKSGTLQKAPTNFDVTEINVTEGKTLKLAKNLTVDTLKAAGTLIFSDIATLTAKKVSGEINCAIEGETLKNHPYITAPAGSAIRFPADTGIEENNGVWEIRDLSAFKGLVLKAPTGVKMNLYGGIWAQGTDTVYTVVAPYTTESKDGYNYYYYSNAKGNYHVRASRSGYITLYKNIYMSEEEAAAYTVEEVVLEKKGTEGFVPQTIYSHTTEVLSKPEAWKSEASMYPKYENALDIPVFNSGKDPHQMTTHEELEEDLAAQDKPDDDMYIFSLGRSEAYGYNIPAVIFTRNDLSSAKTLEEAAALMDHDRLTVYYRAQMHGNEPGGGEGALSMIHHLQDGYAEEILDKIDLIIIPRLNPDGSEDYTRLLPGGVNANRDQTRLESAEMQAFQRGYLLFDPEVVLDSHERVWNNQGGDIAVSTSYTTMNSEAYRQVALEMSNASFRELEANNLCGNYYANQVNNGTDPAMGGAYYPYTGAMYVILESRGIYGGNESMARRAVAHMAAVSGILDYFVRNGEAVKAMLSQERADMAERGKTYEADDLFALNTVTRKANDTDAQELKILNYHGQTVNWSTGDVTFPVKWPSIQDNVQRTRIAPTAYVIPAGESWTKTVLSIMDSHGIPYTFLPAGATLPLQRYGGDTTEATLSTEATYRFPDGCYVFTMNHRRALLLAAMMEPDNTDSAEFLSGLVQWGVIDNNNGIYRYIRDLTADGSVDHEITDADTVNITVYLDGTNGADVNNGLTEATAVKTLEKAYQIMASAMAGASKKSSATLVIIGLYDLGAKASHLPAADFPVTITGKTANDGFSYTGGTSQATQTLEIHGDTTFRNVRLHITNNKSYNFLLANGYRLVLDAGINNTSDSGRYFTVAGGDYDYKDVTAATDVTIRSGTWQTVYAGGYRGSVTGNAKLHVENANVLGNIAATYCGNIGNVEMTVVNTTVATGSAYAIYMGPLEYNATYSVGAILGDSTLTLGENVSAAAAYGSSRNKGNIMGTATVILAGADLNQVPVVAKIPTTDGTTGGFRMVLAADITQNITLDSAFILDLAGHDITGNVTVSGTMTVFDSATDDYTVADGVMGEITGTVTGTLVAKDGYIAAANGFHKFGGQYISSVSLRPGNAGIYYTATFLADEVLLSQLETGVAVSLVDLPGDDFETDGDTLYTVGTTGVMIENILTGDKEDVDRGIMDIYAASYVKLVDGTVQVSEENVAYSLYDILLILKEQNKEAFQSFLTTHNIQNWF